LSINADKKGWIQLPNGTYVETVNGLVNATATISGAVTYFMPKDNTEASISTSAISGEITTDMANTLYSQGCANLTSIVANNLQSLNAINNSSLTSIIAPKAVYCNVLNCSLTAKAIGEILYAAYLEDRQNVYFDFSGGTNAGDNAIESYLMATYSVSVLDVIDRLDITGTIILNG